MSIARLRSWIVLGLTPCLMGALIGCDQGDESSSLTIVDSKAGPRSGVGMRSSCGGFVAITMPGLHEEETITALFSVSNGGELRSIKAVLGYQGVDWHPSSPTLLLGDSSIQCTEPEFALLDLKSSSLELESIPLSQVKWRFVRWTDHTVIFESIDDGITRFHPIDSNAHGASQPTNPP
jgi:hypothetical protein